MSIVWVDGFDLYHSSNLPLSTRYALNLSPSLQTGRFSGQCLQCSSTNDIANLSLPSATDTITLGMALRIDGSQGGLTKFVEFKNSGSVIFTLAYNASTGTLAVYRGDNSNLLGSSPVFPTTTWQYVELSVTRNGSTGTVDLKIDGASVLSLTGQNTGSSAIDNISLRGLGGNTKFDDLYVVNSITSLGECRVTTLVPNADTADKDWAANSGSNNYDRVNQAPADGDTTYISSSNVGDIDLYDMGALGFTPAQIHAVQTAIVARKDDATLRQVRAKLKSGSTTADGGDHTLGTSYNTFRELLTQDPDTSAAWSASGVNAVQVGVELVT